MIIIVEPQFNFHNAPPIRLRVTGETAELHTYPHERVLVISDQQQKRLNKHFCGVMDCRCNGGQAIMLNADGTQWGLSSADFSVVRGQND